MKEKLKPNSGFLGDAKKRGVLLILIFFIIVASIIGYVLYKRGEKGIAAVAEISSAPRVKTIPGVGAPSQEYIRTQQLENILKAREALEEGTTAIPTVTRAAFIGQGEEFEPEEGECSLEELQRAYESGVSAEDIKMRDCSVESLRYAGYSAFDLISAGYDLADVIRAGYDASELRNAGFTAANLREAGFTAQQLAVAGYSANELLEAGYNANQIKEADISATILREAGVSAQTLKDLGFSAEELALAGYDADELIRAGYSIADLKRAGFNANELRNAGLSAAELIAAGFSPAELLAADFDPVDLLAVGLSPSDLQAAGVNENTIADAQRTLLSQKQGRDCDTRYIKQARSQGKTIADLRKSGCNLDDITAKDLLDAGYSAADLKDAGFTARALKNAGVGAADLLTAGFSPKDLREAGYTAKELVDAGAKAQDLKRAGFTANNLKDAGMTAAELAAAGFSANQLRQAGFSPRQLRTAGVSAADMRQAGFGAADLALAGYGADELEAAGFEPGDLRDAGYTASELKRAGVSLRDLLAAGFSEGELLRSGFTLQDLEAAASSDLFPQVSSIDTPKPLAPTTGGIAAVPTDQAADLVLQQLRANQAAQLSRQEQEELVEKLSEAMNTQVGTLVSSWTPPPMQTYVKGKEDQALVNGGANGSGTGTGTDMGNTHNIKAGSIMFAVLDTGINSDEKSPILATIVSGPLKGTKLLGNFERRTKRVVLSFQTMNIPDAPQSIGVNAVAIDADTARTAIADSVDNHYLLRYGSLFASSFLSGLGSALQQSGSETLSIPPFSFQVKQGEYSTAETLAIAAGKVGDRFSDALGDTFRMPPTVYVEAGAGIGILFMNDVAVPHALFAEKDWTMRKS